jgi:hypothetical protein
VKDQARAFVPAGRADTLAEVMLERGLQAHGDPMLRIAARMAKPHISQALTEAIGPGTKVGNFANDLIQFAAEFERRFTEARRQIDMEGRR